MEGIQTFKCSWPWPWIRPYCIPSCITHRPLPIYQISFKSKKLFVDGRTYGRTDIFPPILLGRLLEVDLIKAIHHICCLRWTNSDRDRSRQILTVWLSFTKIVRSAFSTRHRFVFIFKNNSNLTGSLHVLQFQLSPPSPSFLLQYNPEWRHSDTVLLKLSWKKAVIISVVVAVVILQC